MAAKLCCGCHVTQFDYEMAAKLSWLSCDSVSFLCDYETAAKLRCGCHVILHDYKMAVTLYCSCHVTQHNYETAAKLFCGCHVTLTTLQPSCIVVLI